jgi:adenylosuccinate lyase
MKEMEEPFGKNQVGSSAMAYKRNPMRSERIGSLSRYVIVDALNPAITAASQWFERTLDDSANKRLAVAEGFLALDGVLNLYINVTESMVVYKNVIASHVQSELPFMATENILMEAVKRGGDRQELHESIRVHSMEAARGVKEQGKSNDLIERILADDTFKFTKEEILSVMDAKNFIGRSPEQVVEFIDEYIKPVLEANADLLDSNVEINV